MAGHPVCTSCTIMKNFLTKLAKIMTAVTNFIYDKLFDED